MNFCKIFVLIVAVFFSCRQQERGLSEEEIREGKKTLVRINKFLVKKDAEVIESYIKRRNWDMKVTGDGLWYMIYEEGNGKRAAQGSVATCKYKLSLLDGTLCYSSDSLGEKKFKIGQGGVEPGLEAGIVLMKGGDKARFIMPPHLAYGLLGDNNKIPARAIILYEVELVAVTD